MYDPCGLSRLPVMLPGLEAAMKVVRSFPPARGIVGKKDLTSVSLVLYW